MNNNIEEIIRNRSVNFSIQLKGILRCFATTIKAPPITVRTPTGMARALVN